MDEIKKRLINLSNCMSKDNVSFGWVDGSESGPMIEFRYPDNSGGVIDSLLEDGDIIKAVKYMHENMRT